MKTPNFLTSHETARVLKQHDSGYQPICLPESRNIFDPRETWDEIWRSDKYKTPQSRWEKVFYKLESFQELEANLDGLRTVADFGCGAGYFAKHLLSKMTGSVLAVDISPVAMGMARQLNSDPRIDYSVGDATMPCRAPVPLDAVFLVGLIEHVNSPEAVLKNAYDSLRPGGELFIASSHKLSVFHIEKLLLETLGHWKLGYQKDYESRTLIQLVSSQGFTVRSHRVSGCIRKGSLLSRLDRLLSRTAGWGRYLFLIAEKT